MARDVAAEAQAVATPEFAHRLGVERQLARRQQPQRVDRRHRTLGIRVEVAQLVDALVVEVDAHRQVGPHRPDIEQRAAQREFPGPVHFGGGAIARRNQALAEGAKLEARTALERETARADVVDRWQPGEQAVDAEQQHAALQRRQPR